MSEGARPARKPGGLGRIRGVLLLKVLLVCSAHLVPCACMAYSLVARSR